MAADHRCRDVFDARAGRQLARDGWWSSGPRTSCPRAAGHRPRDRPPAIRRRRRAAATDRWRRQSATVAPRLRQTPSATTTSRSRCRRGRRCDAPGRSRVVNDERGVSAYKLAEKRQHSAAAHLALAAARTVRRRRSRLPPPRFGRVTDEHLAADLRSRSRQYEVRGAAAHQEEAQWHREPGDRARQPACDTRQDRRPIRPVAVRRPECSGWRRPHRLAVAQRGVQRRQQIRGMTGGPRPLTPITSPSARAKPSMTALASAQLAGSMQDPNPPTGRPLVRLGAGSVLASCRRRRRPGYRSRGGRRRRKSTSGRIESLRVRCRSDDDARQIRGGEATAPLIAHRRVSERKVELAKAECRRASIGVERSGDDLAYSGRHRSSRAGGAAVASRVRGRARRRHVCRALSRRSSREVAIAERPQDSRHIGHRRARARPFAVASSRSATRLCRCVPEERPIVVEADQAAHGRTRGRWARSRWRGSARETASRPSRA